MTALHCHFTVIYVVNMLIFREHIFVQFCMLLNIEIQKKYNAL